MDYKKHIASKLNLEGFTEEEIASFIALPPNTELGDYALPCFRFAKAMRMSPVAIAEKLKGEFETDEFIEEVNSASGYLNFRVNRKTFVRVMGDVSRVRFEFSGKDLQERGLSGTVCADNSIAITLAEREVDIFEKHAASILQTNIRNIEHGAKDSNYSERLIIQASRMRHISSGE